MISSDGQDGDEVYSEEALLAAIEDQANVITIRDQDLARRTTIWLGMGQLANNISIVTAIGAIICSCPVDESVGQFAKPLAVGSVLMNVGYYVVWRRSGLCRYSVSSYHGPRNDDDSSQPTLTVIVRDGTEIRPIVSGILTGAALLGAFWSDIVNFEFKNITSYFGKAKEAIDEEVDSAKEAI